MMSAHHHHHHGSDDDDVEVKDNIAASGSCSRLHNLQDEVSSSIIIIMIIVAINKVHQKCYFQRLLIFRGLFAKI